MARKPAATPPPSAPANTVIHQRVDAARRGENPTVIARLPSGWAVMGDTQFLPGYCLLLPDPVVPNVNDLDPAARAQFLTDMARLGDAVMAVMRPAPRRINYEMLGNLEPALHAHVFPRYEHERDTMRAKPVWLYGDEMWKSPEHAFNPRKHASIQKALAKAVALPASAGAPLPSDPELWQRAISFAARAHVNQWRKDKVTPYHAHPFRVAMTVRELFGENDPVTLAAAVLHDTIEDTTTDYEDVFDNFGAEVAETVVALTKDMRLPEPQRERAYDEQLDNASWRAHLIKLADVFDNLCDLETQTKTSRQTMVGRCKRALNHAAHSADRPSVARAIRIVATAAGLKT